MPLTIQIKFSHTSPIDAKLDWLVETTYKVTAAMRSALVKLNPALYLAKSPVAVSYATSAPTAIALLPSTPERLTKGFEFKPKLALIPA